MKKIDQKEKIIFLHYKDKIENLEFDEYDILGFLIFIRRHIYTDREKYENIIEFCDLIAHRERNQGKAINAIKGGIYNQYQTRDDSNKLKGYSGIYQEIWKKEWENFFDEFKITYNDKTILEITLCIYSLAQYTKYIFGKNNKCIAEMSLFQEEDGSLTISTKEIKDNTPFVNFARYGKYDFKYIFPCGDIDEEVETYRDDKNILRLKTKTGTILI